MKSLIMKRLAIGIIFLFVGVTMAPVINFNTVKASLGDDLVEVTTQICGIQGYGNTMVKLTREQYQNLEEYLVEFRARLNQTTTREEPLLLFKEVVVELHKYGLLPKGMSLPQAQTLVYRWSPQQMTNGSFKGISEKTQQIQKINFLCLLAGQTTTTSFDNIGTLLVSFMPLIFNNVAMAIFRLQIFVFLSLLCMTTPLAVMNRMNLGYHTFFGNVPASGWMTTIGLLGIKTIQGNMSGDINVQGTSWWPEISQVSIKNPAALGFSGIKIGFGTGDPEVTLWEGKEYFYIGSALLVAVSTE